ncbi:hypothetical protein H6801_02635 [Candidatus Nomurabacteria bacterium]|jgi:uncharacterized protein YybS (DUF2232 family)|nr:hypothetical protein [Candidatus Nomurabacteria bacterium]
MGIFGQILLGLIIIVVSVLILMKNYQVANSIPLPFFESKMGPGSSYLIWKIFAIIGVFIGFTVMFGFYDEVLGWILSPITKMISPSQE